MVPCARTVLWDHSGDSRWCKLLGMEIPLLWHPCSVKSRDFGDLLLCPPLWELALSGQLSRALGFRAAGDREDLIFKAQEQESIA